MSRWKNNPRRCEMLPILAGALLATVGVGALAQTSRVMQSEVRDPEYQPPYDNSKADLALKAFDEAHPQCALWTDWRKLCSRIGPNGQAYCRLDAAHSVKASHPFCAHYMYVNGARPYFTAAEIYSRNRFLNAKLNEYRSDRPFNGRTVAAVDVPACNIWSHNNIPVCSKLTQKNIASCESYRKILRSTDQPLECVGFKKPVPCHNLISGSPYKTQDYGDIEIDISHITVNSSPVIGVYCG